MNVRAKAFFVAVFSGAVCSASAALTWEKTEIELHPKPGDQEAVANFKYENKGTKPVHINNVRSSCGCTVASLKKNDVAPGEKGEVTATFKIGGRVGTQQKTVTVETDDPEQPVTNLLLTAVIAQPIDIQPTFVFWQSGEAAKPKKITVTARKDIAINKLEVTSSIPQFKTSVEKGAKNGQFIVSVTPTDTSKPLSSTLTLKPDYPQTFVATARVTAPATPQQ